MPTRRFKKQRRVDPLEQAVAEKQVRTGIEVTVRYSRMRARWEASSEERTWQSRTRNQLLIQVLDHLSRLDRERPRPIGSRTDGAHHTVAPGRPVEEPGE